MKLFDLCTVFPASLDDWAIPSPAKALPFDVRAKVKTKYGTIFAASDISKRRSASRLGIATRPYEPGDALNAVSLNQYVRTGEILTRVDAAPGRQKAGVIFHSYQNMLYKSENAKGNKGQLALTLSALIEMVHLNHLHSFKMVYTQNLLEELVLRQHQLRQLNYFYIVTDLLYDGVSSENLVGRLPTRLQELGINSACVVVVRDPLEWFEDNPLLNSSDVLLPFSGATTLENRFSGADYLETLYRQYAALVSGLRTLGSTVSIVTGNSNVEAALNPILNHLLRGA